MTANRTGLGTAQIAYGRSGRKAILIAAELSPRGYYAAAAVAVVPLAPQLLTKAAIRSKGTGHFSGAGG